MADNIPHPTHEQGVEKFYSHGSKIRAHEAGGFLSFGYWDKDGCL